MKYGIYIGGPKPKAVKEFRGAINDILSSGVDQATLQKALEILSTGLRAPSGTSIMNCHVVGEHEYGRNDDPNVPEEGVDWNLED